MTPKKGLIKGLKLICFKGVWAGGEHGSWNKPLQDLKRIMIN